MNLALPEKMKPASPIWSAADPKLYPIVRASMGVVIELLSLISNTKLP